MDYLNPITVTMNSIQTLLHQISNVTVGRMLITFSVATIVTYASFPLFTFLFIKQGDLLRQLQRLQEKPVSSSYFWFVLRYSVVTGLFASAIIEIAHGALSLSAAVMIGVFSPFLFRDHAMKVLQDNIIRELEGMLRITTEQVRNDPRYDDILAEINRIYEEKAPRNNILAVMKNRTRGRSSDNEYPGVGKGSTT